MSGQIVVFIFSLFSLISTRHDNSDIILTINTPMETVITMGFNNRESTNEPSLKA